MAQNNFWVDLVASLKKIQSKKQIQSDAKNLGDIKVPLIGTLSKAKTKAQLKQDLASLNGTINLTGKVNKKGIVTSVQQATTQAQSQANKTPIQVSMNLKKDKLINDIKIFGQQNTKLFKDANMTAKYNSLLDNAKLATSAKQIKDLRMQLSAMRSEIKATNLSGLTLGDAFKKTFKRATELFTGTGGVMLLSQQLRKAWTEALELDSAFTDLIKVQDELTRGDYPEYLERCNKKAQELATTQKALIESVTEFSRSGYNLTESNELSEQATILSNVGDMNASDSAKAIISGVQAYDLVDGYDDAVSKAEALIDKYNEIGNTASITTAEIAQGVQTVGSVFADANTSVDEFISLLAAGNRQYQDADALALALRTSVLRIRGCTTELELMGEETEGVITSTAKLEEKIKALTNVNGSGGVEILEADGETFRSIYDIFLDISKVYQDMSDTDQSALLELISGKHRASAISATLNNMSEAQEIYQRSLEASGSAQEEYDKYLQSSEAALNRFKGSMTETYQSVLNGETVTGLLNCANATLQFVNSLGLVESTLKGLVAIGIVKVITTLSTAFKASAISASNFGTALNTVKNMSTMARGTTEYTNALQTLKIVSAGLSDVQLKQVLASKALSDADRIAILRTSGLTKAQSQAKLAQMGLTQSTKAQTTAQKTATASTFSLTAAVKGFGASLKATFLRNPVGTAIMAISTTFGAVTSAINSANQKAEEARQKAKDAASEANTLGDEVAELTAKYIALSEAVKTDASAKEDLISTQAELLKKLGLEGESIDDLIAKYGSLSNAIRQASLDSLKNSQIDLIAGVDATREELLDAGKDNFGSSDWKKSIVAMGKDAGKAWQALEDAGIVSSGVHTDRGGEWFLSGDNSVEGVLENFKTIENALSALRDSDAFTAEELSENPLYQELYERYSGMKDAVKSYQSSIADLNENLAQQTMLAELQGSTIPKTEEEFETFRNELVETAIASKQFIGNEKEITDAINGYLSTVPEFEGFYSVPLENELDKVDELLGQDDFSNSSIIKAWKSVGDINDSSIAETKEQLLELAESGNLTVEAFKDSSIAEEFLKETGLSAEEAIEKINKLIEKLKELDTSKSAITSLSDAKSAFSNFNSIYDEITGGQTVSADSISSLEQSFGTVDTGLALENFRNILATTDDIDAQKQALDDLATAYLDNSDLLDGLTEETKDYVKAELEKIGVTNADEFVEDRLNDTTKQLLKNLKQFSTVFAKNSNALKNSSKGTVEYNDALSEIKDGLSELFSYEIDGELFTFDIPDDFVAENIEEIEKAASGSVDALYRLKAELAKEYVANVELNVPESAVGGLRQQINGWINEINIDDIEVGTSLNDTPLIQGLNNLVDAGIMTRNNMNNILASIGVTPEITYENAEIEIPNTSSNSSLIDVALVGLKALKTVVKVPKIDYKVGSKATSASYASPSGGSSGGGGGGGGGSSSAEETTETFDWIETAIIRTQESAERLDKTVGNVYETWSKRNSALSSEINKVKDELVLQQQAYDAYMKKANSVGLSEDYKKKIQSGALQIEDIKDEKLREKISQYQEWYEKATECKDAIQDLNISLGDLAEQKFDNIEKEFSDLIALIEGKADIIEERINRTEEQGYFASANYYKQQLQYESQEMDKLKKQYTELITQRDSAVLNGYIEEGSEAYNDMTKAILDVQQAMEESATATVELNNAIRDLNWEIFDYIEERIGKIAEESNFLIDLLDNQSLYNENGSFNERGQSAAYLHGKNVELYTQQAKDYANELKKINADLAKDPSNKDLIERREELLDLQQESISNIYAEKEAVKSLVEEGINLHLSKLTELIDKYKKAMTDAKSLFEYQENISQQTSEISRLQKILKSYEGNDDTEETRKSIQEYQNQLKDAEKNLETTHWDRYISESEELLTDLYDEYEETLNARLDNIDTLFADVINDANANANKINDTINSVAKSVGYSISLLDKTAQEIKNTIKAQTTNEVQTPKGDAYVDDYSGVGLNGVTGDSSNAGKDVKAEVNVIVNNLLPGGKIDYSKIQLSKLKKYAKGGKITKDQLAWTQEDGTELIYRASDGAMLTPLGKGMVFTHEMSENLWEMAQGNMPNLVGDVRLPNVTPVNSSNISLGVNIGQVVANNPEEFGVQLRKHLSSDRNVQKMIHELNFGQALGRNSLNIKKYK